MRTNLPRLLTLALASTAAVAAPAFAQDPAFKFEKPPEKPTDWKVQAKGGLLRRHGNSQSRNGNLG